MSRTAGSSVPMETENQREEFIADVRSIIAGFRSSSHGVDTWGEPVGGGPFDGASLFDKALYGRDRLIYQRALQVGLALAGQVAFGADVMTTETQGR